MERSWRLPALLIGLAAGNPAHGGEIWPVNGHEYQVVLSGRITWEDARAAAQALGPGWDLTTIGSGEENDFVTSLLNTTLPLGDRAHFWLGATDAAVEGTWEWIDGTPFTYTNWWSGEPNNFPDEDFLAFDLRGGSWAWNDVASHEDKLIGYVAERSLTPHNVLDHFQCYKAKGEALKVYVDLEDEFGAATVLVREPEFFCNPVDKNGEGIRSPALHLTCYKIKGEADKRDVLVENQFGEQALDVRKPELLCVPSSKVDIEH